MIGDMKIEDRDELFELRQRNFIRYWKAKVYTDDNIMGLTNNSINIKWSNPREK